jgi:hypothetical protein
MALLHPFKANADLPDQWSDRSYGLTGVAYGNGLYVAVGFKGRIQSSPDGVEWTIRNSGTANSLYGISFEGELFLAVGNKGTVLSSTDGISWAAKTSGTTNALSAITFGKGKAGS